MTGKPLQVDDRHPLRRQALQQDCFANSSQAAQDNHAPPKSALKVFENMLPELFMTTLQLAGRDSGQVKELSHRPATHTATPAKNHDRRRPCRLAGHHRLD